LVWCGCANRRRGGEGGGGGLGEVRTGKRTENRVWEREPNQIAATATICDKENGSTNAQEDPPDYNNMVAQKIKKKISQVLQNDQK
jgi:hypothetical protein